ncbi:MAG: glycosyltransferase [Parasporobacterium sp.]|nr:glycosyltransferase [Parasporobacterium sp.]
MNKLTVCLMNDSFPPIVDGVANAVVNYAKYIERDWGHAIVATPAYPGADDSIYSFPVIRYPSIDVRNISTGYMFGIPFSPELSSRLGRQKVDILHSHCPMTSALLGRALHKRIDAPLIMTYHTKYDIDIANVLKNKALQQSSIKSIVTNISCYDEVWVVSEGAGENLRSLGFQGDYVVMPNGVDLPREEAKQSDMLRDTAGYDLPDGVPVFLFVGRLMWYKGIRIILDAARRLLEDGLDFRMIFIGDGGDGEQIRHYCKRSGLSGKVFFTGVISDREVIRSFYTRADLFLFPSTFDSNGLVVREAAACNLGSVLIRGSCAAEGVRDGHNALLIEENAASMYQLLKEVMKQPESMRRIGLHAGEELYLSWENAVVKAVERYNIVLELHKSGAFREHDRFSDNLLATQGDMMYTFGKIGQVLNQGKTNPPLIIGMKSEDRKKYANLKNSQTVRKNLKKR